MSEITLLFKQSRGRAN